MKNVYNTCIKRSLFIISSRIHKISRPTMIILLVICEEYDYTFTKYYAYQLGE